MHYGKRVSHVIGVAKVRIHVTLCFACMYAVAILAHRIGRPELANSIAAVAY